jgi:WhiB family transcriptional regulator, redox-sensing transcriptional regulator
MTAQRDWRELAACRKTVTARYDPFFDGTEQGERAAIAICRTCRVQGECLAYAVRTGQSYGVWGGRPQRELRRLIALDRLGRAQVRASARHRNATKDRCEHGHRFDPANTYYTPTGERRCRTCRRAANRARDRRRRQQARRLRRLAAETHRVRRQGGEARG